MKFSEEGFIKRDSKTFAYLTVGLLLTAAICVVDYVSGPSIPFLMVHFIPVIWITWTVGWEAAMAMAFLNALAWILLATFTRSTHASSWPPMWNIFRALMFLAIAYTLCMFKRLADLERKWAFEDPLTGLANRRAFFRWAQREISRARRRGESLTVALLDVDDFKKINDRWGHPQGDKVLIWIGKLLRSHLRSADMLARLGGDELVILLSNNTAGSAHAVMEKIRQSLLDSSRELGMPVSVSIGVVTFDRVPQSIETILQAADRQMYQVKQNAKNNVGYEVLAP